MTEDAYALLPPLRQGLPRTTGRVAIAILMTIGALVWAISKTDTVDLLPSMMMPVVWMLVVAVAMEIPFTLLAPYSLTKRYLEKVQLGLLWAVPLTEIGVLLGVISLSAMRSPFPLIANYPDLVLAPLLIAPTLALGWRLQGRNQAKAPRPTSQERIDKGGV